MTRTQAIDDWLRATVAPAYDALKADPARAITIIQLRARLAAEQEKALAEQATPPNSPKPPKPDRPRRSD